MSHSPSSPPPARARLAKEGRELLTTVTKGEWRLDNRPGRRTVEARSFDGVWRELTSKVRGGSPEEANANAEFIVWARNNFGEVLDLLETQAQRIRALETAIADVKEAANETSLSDLSARIVILLIVDPQPITEEDIRRTRELFPDG